MIAMVEESGRGGTTYYGGAQARAPEGLDKYLGNTGWFVLIYFVLLSNSDAPLGCKLEGVMKKIPPIQKTCIRFHDLTIFADNLVVAPIRRI